MIMAPMEPGSGNAVAGAMDWIEGMLSGSVATAIAVIAVASLGLLMLSGRIEVRRAGQVVLGCFILFGASSIAAGIISSLEGVSRPAAAADPDPPPPYPIPAATRPATDPYAGAAVPPRR